MSVFESHQRRNPRLTLFYVVIALTIAVLIGGMGYRQIIQNPYYSEREKKQNLRRVLFPGPRGNIYDREDNLLVANRPRFSAAVYLAQLRHEFRREEIAMVRENREQDRSMSWRDVQVQSRARVVQRYLDEVNEVTGRDRKVDASQLDQHFRQFLLLPYPLVRDLDAEEFALVLEQIPSESKIHLHSSSARYYPEKASAAHILGYVSSTQEVSDEGLPGDHLMTFNLPGSVGRSGLEREFDSHLQGKTGMEIWVVDPSGFRYGHPLERHPPVQGEDLKIAIDIDIQNATEDEFGDYTGAAIAMDVNTGEVLALASKPAYDLNRLSPFIPQRTFTEIEEAGGWLNRGVQGVYPPGSTFKIITALAALRNGEITPQTTSYCAGSFRVGGRNFPCHNRVGHGEINLSEALSLSCNVYFYEHGVETGIRSISAEARRFGLGERTGIEIPFESGRTVVPDPDWKRSVRGQSWFAGDTANVSIGQGDVLVTPLQMAAFTASLARNETLTRPTLLFPPPSADPDFNPEPIGLSPHASSAIIDGMEQAVEDGTAHFAEIPGIRMAAKTGTAQVRRREGTLHLAWFIGFAPIDDPQVAVTIMVEGTDISDDYAGGTTAAPIAKGIFEAYFEKYGRPGEQLAAREN